MLTPSLLLKRLSSINNDSAAIRTVVFALADMEDTTIGEYLFALPVEAVVRAIVYPSQKTVLKEGIGMINLGEQTITVVDLRYKFATTELTTESSQFLILFHTQAGELCGLPVKDAPIFIDIPVQTIRPLPAAYRQVNQLNFASHVAIVPQGEDLEPLKILLLGMSPELLSGNSNYQQHLSEFN